MSNDKKYFKEEKLYYSLTYEDTIQILNLIDDYQYRNLNIKLGDLKIKIDKEGMNTKEKIDDIQEGMPETFDYEEQEVKVASKIENDETSDDNKENLDDLSEKNNDKNDLELDGSVAVEASITGVFYKSPSPGEEPYVKVGSKVKKGDELGLVEVMKLFNTVNAPCDGVVKEILVEDESVVNVEDVLMTIEPI